MARDHAALHAYLDGRLRAPLAWGDRANDCVSHANGAVRAQTGRDLLKELGVSWSSERGAVRVLKRFGGVKAAVDKVLTPIAPAMARRGDIGLVEIEGRPSLVVIEGDLVVGPGLKGHVRLPRRALTAAWSLDGV